MKHLLVTSLIMAIVVLGFIGFFGGVQYYTYSKFLPASESQLKLKGDFMPDIYPVFTEGGTMGLKCIIPYLFYREKTSERRPMVVVSTHDTFNNYGYANKSKVVFETVTAKNEIGTIFRLVAAEASKEFSLLGLGSGSGTERLGAINGEKITIFAKGYALTTKGEREEFIYEQTWIESHSSKMGLGVSFSE